MVSSAQNSSTRRSRRLAGLHPCTSPNEENRARTRARRQHQRSRAVSIRVRSSSSMRQAVRRTSRAQNRSGTGYLNSASSSQNDSTIPNDVQNSQRSDEPSSPMPVNANAGSSQETECAFENTSYAPDSEPTSAVDTLDTSSILGEPNSSGPSLVPQHQSTSSQNTSASRGPSLRSNTRQLRGREWARRRRPLLVHRNASVMSISRTHSEEIGSGAMPVRGESFCACPQASQSRDLQCSCGDEDKLFEWTWDTQTKSGASDLSDDGRDVRFHVNYSSGTAAARGNLAMTNRQHFWEIKMTTPVYGTDMMVGVGTAASDLDAYRYSFCSLLGRDAESWGLSYYGRIQHKGKFVNLKNSKFGQGSIVGIHLDMWRGILSFYKNRKPIGVAYTGLNNKSLYPMVSSTAARTGMRLIKACSFPTSLQFLCCQVLRHLVPPHLNVIDALKLPPGLQAFLTNNLRWLLRPNELAESVAGVSSKCNPRKRIWSCHAPEHSLSSDDEGTEDFNLAKRKRRSRSRHEMMDSSDSSSSSSDEILPSSEEWTDTKVIQPS